MGDTSSQTIRVNEVEWTALAPTAKAKVLWIDRDKTPGAVDPFRAGSDSPDASSCGHQLLYVIEGAIADEHGTTTSGNVGYRPNGCVHSVSSKNGATVLAILNGGISPRLTPLARRHRKTSTSARSLGRCDRRNPPKAIWHDSQTKRRAALVRFDPGAQLPRHKHVGNELIFVIEGSNADESGEVLAGNFNYRPDGCLHTVSSKNGATILAVVTGGVEVIN